MGHHPPISGQEIVSTGSNSSLTILVLGVIAAAVIWYFFFRDGK